MGKNNELLKKVANLCSSPFHFSNDSAKNYPKNHSKEYPKIDSSDLPKSTFDDSYTFCKNEFFTLLKDFLPPHLQSPIIIAGLGNPTPKYAKNRHNAGFMIVDKIAQMLELEWENANKFEAQIATIKNATTNIHLLKPQSFMNLSGVPLQNALKFYKINDFVVLHDELDIDFGYVCYKVGGSSGGHNGLKSIDEKMGNNYMRLRFGIGRGVEAKSSTDSADFAKSSVDFTLQNPQNKKLKNHQVISYVLGDFDISQAKKLDSLVLHSALSILYFLITRDFAKTQNLFTLNPAKNNPKKAINASQAQAQDKDKEAKSQNPPHAPSVPNQHQKG
ncbi:aminoacyl-tRNA hydrolase [Helicobacter sp. T3_23-1056]